MLTHAELKSECQITDYTPYLTLTGELWGVFCEDSIENWPHLNGTILYITLSLKEVIHSAGPYWDNFHLPSMPMTLTPWVVLPWNASLLAPATTWVSSHTVVYMGVSNVMTSADTRHAEEKMYGLCHSYWWLLHFHIANLSLYPFISSSVPLKNFKSLLKVDVGSSSNNLTTGAVLPKMCTESVYPYPINRET